MLRIFDTRQAKPTTLLSAGTGASSVRWSPHYAETVASVRRRRVARSLAKARDRGRPARVHTRAHPRTHTACAFASCVFGRGREGARVVATRRLTGRWYQRAGFPEQAHEGNVKIWDTRMARSSQHVTAHTSKIQGKSRSLASTKRSDGWPRLVAAFVTQGDSGRCPRSPATVCAFYWRQLIRGLQLAGLLFVPLCGTARQPWVMSATLPATLGR